MLKSLRHWLRESGRPRYNGPTLGAILMRSGMVIKLDLTDSFASSKKLGEVSYEDMTASLVGRPGGGWSGTATVLSALGNGPINLYTRGEASLDEALDAMKAKLADYASERKRLEDPVVKLESLLKGHDWYHVYSDDYSVVRRGEAALKRLLAHVESMDPETARPLWEKHAPEAIKFPGGES